MGIKEMKLKDTLRKGELSKISGTRVSTIKYYSELGILPFIQKEKRLSRMYDKATSLQRLKDIRASKRKGMTIQELQNLYRGQC